MKPEVLSSAGLVAQQCRMQGRRVCLALDEQRWISFPTSRHPQLAQASQTDLELIKLAEDGRTIRWEKLGVVIAVEDIAAKRFASAS